MDVVGLEGGQPRTILVLVGAIVASVVAHGVLALVVSEIERPERTEPVWVEVAVVTPPPPPAPEPAPAPEPEPPKPEPQPTPRPTPRPIPPEPEEVEYEETTNEPEPTPEPDRPQPRRLSQGLDNNSLMNNGLGAFSARRGNTTAAAADTPQLAPDETGEFAIVPYASVTTAPRITRRPQLVVPDSVREAEIQGRVEAELVIGADGSVLEVEIVDGLDPAADAACADALRGSRWKAGERDGTPVVVRGVPYSCRFEMAVQ